MGEKKRVIAVDGTSLAYRAFHALPRLSASSGRPTGATLGFLNMVLRLLEDYKPLTIVVAFDHPRKTFRHAVEKEYKVSRKPMPDMLRPQIEDIKEILLHLGFPVLEVPGFEGDDIIGSLKERLGKEYMFFIVTSDLDLLQLLDENTVLLQPVRGVTRLRPLRSEDLQEELGITPSQVVDFLALSGDASDDIRGIQGIGEKRAAQLLREFGTLEGILAHVDELPPTLRRNLLESRERLEVNRILVTIRRDVPLECSIEPWSFARVNWPALLRKLDELELQKLRERIERKRSSEVLMLQGQHLLTVDGEEPPERGAKYLFRVVAPDPGYLEKVLKTPGVFWGPVLLFLSYPVVFPFSRVLECVQGGQVHGEVLPLLEEARMWVEDQPLLSLAYREVELPLLQDMVLGRITLCDRPFPDLPLFGPPIAFSVEDVVLCRGFQEVRRKGGYIALPTLYGWRFLGKEGDSAEEMLACQRWVIEEELFHLLVWALRKKGVCRFQREGRNISAEMYGVMKDLEDFLLDAFQTFSQGQWQVMLEKKDGHWYGLSVVGEGG